MADLVLLDSMIPRPLIVIFAFTPLTNNNAARVFARAKESFRLSTPPALLEKPATVMAAIFIFLSFTVMALIAFCVFESNFELLFAKSAVIIKVATGAAISSAVGSISNVSRSADISTSELSSGGMSNGSMVSASAEIAVVVSFITTVTVSEEVAFTIGDADGSEGGM